MKIATKAKANKQRKNVLVEASTDHTLNTQAVTISYVLRLNFIPGSWVIVKL